VWDSLTPTSLLNYTIPANGGDYVTASLLHRL